MVLATASTGARDRSNTGKASKFLSGVIATCKIAFRNLSVTPIVTCKNAKNTRIHITTSTNPIRDLQIPLIPKPSKNDHGDWDRRGIVTNFLRSQVQAIVTLVDSILLFFPLMIRRKGNHQSPDIQKFEV